ncbi:MAG: ATP-binding cassette domain-containing protein [Rhizobiaceae bacterium]|nr:ATP-binding cassette domain-containing protein [Rhizobiaceae bacterium]
MPARTAAGKAPVLAVNGIDKRFPGVHALKQVSFDVVEGEIHALVGENGAGKSTLMRILAGVHPPDAGQIEIDGRPVSLRDPADALAAGIAMVYQDTRLAPTLDVAWNIALGHEPGGALFVDRAAMDAEAAAVLTRLGSTVDLRAEAGRLNRAERQQVEIARALARKARVLILDEPTSALTGPECDALHSLMNRLRDEGVAIIFISHRLGEVLSLADRITVLKDGEVSGALPGDAADEQSLVALMVGRAMGTGFPPRAAAPGREVLLVPADREGSIPVRVRAGEIVGFGGIQGAGQQDMARRLFGLGAAANDKAGFSFLGETVRPDGPADALKCGIIYVPADRRRESLFMVHDIASNIALPHVSGWSRLGVVDQARTAQAVDAEARRLAVRAPDWETGVSTLSGGNQQKVVFARWFIAEARLYVFDEPTQGVDVATKAELYRLIRARAEAGAAVIVISSDLVELIGLTDRIIVFNDGQPVADLESADATEAGVIAAAVAARSDAPGALTPAALSARASGWASLLAGRHAPALILAAIILMLASAAALLTPFFLTPRNFASMAGQIAPLAIASLGQMAVILLGGIDLTTGPVISLVTTIASHLITPGSVWPPVLAAALCIACGAAVGLFNALLIVRLRIPDLVATLGTFSVVQGLALIVRPSPGGTLDPAFAGAVLYRIWMVPVAFIAAVALFILFEALLARGRIGARLYATGSSADAAMVTGIRTGRVKALAYVFSGTMAALAGLIIAARIGSGDPQAGATFTLASVTAVVAGGTSVFGGSGTAGGTVLGATLIILVQNVLNQFQVSAYWQYVWTGVLTLIAVGFHGLRSPGQRARMMLHLRRLFQG